ncbi:hypothetical protein VTJ49DRAFT_3854 [Mycothermus thermophilus]|uniref:Tubby C-terminal-like domain-containing protein n=1 Tax=Humicola insolens TaxID=85995 RepID=A0ABR3VR67_HUMIN
MVRAGLPDKMAQTQQACPLAVSNLRYPQPQALVMKEWGDAFKVTLGNNQIMTVQRRGVFGFSDLGKQVKELYMGNTKLLTITHDRVWFGRPTISINRVTGRQGEDGTPVMKTKPGRAVWLGRRKMTANLMPPGSEPVKVTLKTKTFNSAKGSIVNAASKQTLATIERKRFSAREMLAGQQSYTVTVQPNVDMAVVSAMMVCFDEFFYEGK